MKKSTLTLIDSELARFAANTACVAVLLAFCVVALNLQVLNLPPWWDSLAAVFPQAYYMADNGFNPFLPGAFELNGGVNTFHPPLITWLVALLAVVFGKTFFAPHVLMLLFSFTGVFFTYLLGKHLFGPTVGFAASVLLLFSSLWLAQTSIIYYDLPLAALGVAAFYCYWTKNDAGYLISGVALVLTKEPGIILALLLSLHAFLYSRKRVLLVAFPLLVFLAWTISQKLATGYAFVGDPAINGAYQFNAFVPGLENIVFTNFLRDLFFADYHWVLLFALIAYAYTKRKVILQSPREWLSGAPLLFLAFIAAYVYVAYFTWYLPRYVVSLLPFVYLLGCAAFDKVASFQGRWAVFLVIMMILFISAWSDPNLDVRGGRDERLAYLDMQRTHLEAASFIESSYPNSTILTSWPVLQELSDPRMGYVTKKIRVVSLDDKYVEAPYYSANWSNADYVVCTPESFHPDVCDAARSAGMNLTRIKRFEMDGFYYEIYSVVR